MVQVLITALFSNVTFFNQPDVAYSMPNYMRKFTLACVIVVRGDNMDEKNSAKNSAERKKRPK